MSEELQSRYEDMMRQFEDYVKDTEFDDLKRSVERIHKSLETLPEKVEGIRSRGYVYRSYLENKVAVLQKQWQELRPQIDSAIYKEASQFDGEFNRAKALLKNLERQTGNEKVFEKLAEEAEETLSSVKDAISKAENRIRDLFNTLQTDMYSTESQLNEIDWILDQKENVSFEFGPSENVFLVAEAELILTGKGGKDPDGFLFLTNERVIFEQREKTGKRLGMFGGKMEHEIEWETSLSAIADISIENRGLFGGKDILHFTLREGNASEITVEVKGRADNKFWQKQIKRMIDGETEDERAIQPDESVLSALKKDIPTTCHVCDATLPKVTQGASSVSCAYCGTTISL